MSRIFSISVCTSTLAEILLGLRILRRNSTSHRVCRGGSRTRILQIPENEKYVQVERGSAECVRTVILTTRELLKAVPLVSAVSPSRDYGSETSVHRTVASAGRYPAGKQEHVRAGSLLPDHCIFKCSSSIFRSCRSLRAFRAVCKASAWGRDRWKNAWSSRVYAGEYEKCSRKIRCTAIYDCLF